MSARLCFSGISAGVGDGLIGVPVAHEPAARLFTGRVPMQTQVWRNATERESASHPVHPQGEDS
jgi:hypothetical protein